MRYKFTNFCINKKLKSCLFNSLLFLLIFNNIYAISSYKMSISNIEVLSSKSIQASVYIENLEEEFELTSYQCALSINQNIDLSSLQLNYVAGSSELLNEPNLRIGIDNIDGPTELTFVSFIGNDIISSRTLVGTFILEGNLNINNINLLDIQWDFEGTICTIITGKDFVNITNPSSHASIFSNNQNNDVLEKIKIMNVTASSTSDTNTAPECTIDGKGYNDGDQYARWATQSIPASLIFDVGQIKKICKTRFSFFYFHKGRIYNYNVRISTDKTNWNEVLSNVSSKEEEWSEEIFSPVEGRYVELEIISSVNNPSQWTNLWEAEIWGIDVANCVDEEKKEEYILPNEFGISQNFPNPFNPTTKVNIQMRESGYARLDIYNLLGERVLAVLEQELSEGVHEINIDGSRLASGVYIYKFDVGNKFSEIKKMNLVK